MCRTLDGTSVATLVGRYAACNSVHVSTTNSLGGTAIVTDVNVARGLSVSQSVRSSVCHTRAPVRLNEMPFGTQAFIWRQITLC